MENNQPFETKPVGEQSLDLNTQNKLMNNKPKLKHVMSDFYHENKIFVWLISLGLIILLAIASWIFWPRTVNTSEGAIVEIVINAPENLPIGEETVIDFTITNKDSSTLSDVSLDIVYPEGMKYVSANVKAGNYTGTNFALPILKSGDIATVKLQVKAAGSVGDQVVIKTKLNYKYKNISAAFSKESSKDFTLGSSGIKLDITGPSRVSSGGETIVTARYANTTDTPVSGMRIKFTYPDGFSFASADPSASFSNHTFVIGDLAVGQSGEVTIKGNLSAVNLGELKTIRAELMLPNSSGGFYTEGEARLDISVGSIPLPLDISFTQPADEKQGTVAGQTITGQIRYSNGSDVPAQGVNISLEVIGDSVIPSSFAGESALPQGGKLVWNASKVRQLENLTPAQSGVLTFSVQLKDPITTQSQKNFSVKFRAHITSLEYPSGFSSRTVDLKINSQAKLSMTLEKYSGSIPPQVGNETGYKVSVHVKNTVNDLKEGIVTGYVTVPAAGFNVNSITGADSNNFKFDTGTGKFTWNMGDVSAHAGTFSPVKKLTFILSFTPAASQVNEAVGLVNNVQFTSSDTFTNNTVTSGPAKLSTTDIGGNGNLGRVVE